MSSSADYVRSCFSGLRQHQQDGQRSPHKPLLVLLALGRLSSTGSSAVAWSEVEDQLADLISQFGRPSRTGRRQSAAYPFTRLRSDQFWSLDRDVPMDNVGPLDAGPITGYFEPTLERSLQEPGVLEAAARMIVESQFPMTVAPDVLTAVGLDPDTVLGFVSSTVATREQRRRSAAWRTLILQGWDYRCALCGYDGRLGSAPVGLEAAHVRWFNHGGPDDADNGLTLCSLHHKLFDRGALGLDDSHTVLVSQAFSARTEAAERVYRLHGVELRPRPGTPLPALRHIAWQRREVFKAPALGS